MRSCIHCSLAKARSGPVRPSVTHPSTTGTIVRLTANSMTLNETTSAATTVTLTITGTAGTITDNGPITGTSATINAPVPTLADTINRLMRMQKRLLQDFGREPSAEEIADEMQLPVERVRAVLKMAQQPISLHAPMGDDNDASFGDFIEDKSTESPSDITSFSLLKDKLGDVLSSLNARERRVLELRFGLGDGYARTLEEVGKQFNVTRERIRQIESKALRKMRHPSRVRQLQGFLEFEPDMTCLESLAVDLDRQARGIGSALAWTALEAAGADTGRPAALNVSGKTLRARALYERLGFKAAGEKLRFSAHRSDLVTAMA